MNRVGGRGGVTLLEMMIVLAIIGLIAGISFPSAASGLDSLRLRSAADGVASFFTAAMTRADRRQEAMEVVINPAENVITLFSSEPGYTRRYEFENGIHLGGDQPASFLLLPGGTPPAISVDIYNKSGAHKTVRIDPVTGAPQT